MCQQEVLGSCGHAQEGHVLQEGARRGPEGRGKTRGEGQGLEYWLYFTVYLVQ